MRTVFVMQTAKIDLNAANISANRDFEQFLSKL
jgi:hypothetical protein